MPPVLAGVAQRDIPELYQTGVAVEVQSLIRQVLVLRHCMHPRGALVSEYQRDCRGDGLPRASEFSGFGAQRAVIAKHPLHAKAGVPDGGVIGNCPEHVPGVGAPRWGFGDQERVVRPRVRPADPPEAEGILQVDVRRDEVQVRRKPAVDVEHAGHRAA